MTNPVSEGDKPISKRRDWLPVAREALAECPSRAEFSAPTLRLEIIDHLRPDIDALREQDLAVEPRTFTWLAALDAWEAENPGLSDSSCRKLCDRLVAEGVLTLRQERRGWYVRNWYRRVPVRAGTEEVSP